MLKILLSTILLSFFSLSSAIAQTPTTTTTIRDSIKEKVDQELSQIKQNVAKKGYVGTITEIKDAGFILKNLSNETREAIVAPDGVIRLANGKDGTLKDLKSSDFVIAMGNIDSNGLLTARRIVVTTAPAIDTRKVFFGKVIKVSSSQLTLELTDKTTKIVKINSETKYNGTNKLTNIQENQNLVVVTNGPDTSLNARRIHIIK